MTVTDRKRLKNKTRFIGRIHEHSVQIRIAPFPRHFIASSAGRKIIIKKKYLYIFFQAGKLRQKTNTNQTITKKKKKKLEK